MRTSTAGIDAIKAREGLRLKAYPDPATGGDPWTIGYGHTGPDVHPGLCLTHADCDAQLISDLARFEVAIEQAVDAPLTQNQFDALVSFAYNVGLANFRGSTLLKRLNSRDYRGAADQFLRWDMANGRHMAGLAKRRGEERAQFLTQGSSGS